MNLWERQPIKSGKLNPAYERSFSWSCDRGMSVQFPYSQKDSHQNPKSGGEMKHSDNVLTVEAACSEKGSGERGLKG